MRTSKAIGMPSQWPIPLPPISPIETRLGVHAGDRADETGIGDVGERDPALRLGDGQHGVILEPPVASVVEDPAVVEGAVLGGRAAERETGAVEELGDEVGDHDVLDVHPRAVGDPAHLLEEPLGDVLALGGDDPA